MPPYPETGLVTLPEVVTGKLAGKFGEISLFDQHADFELGSASNSNSTSPWAIVCEPTTQPSHVDPPPSDSNPLFGFYSDSNPLFGFYSNSAYEFYFGSDPKDPESEDNSTEQPLSGPASGMVITSTPAG
jgi:hypothetical protein